MNMSSVRIQGTAPHTLEEAQKIRDAFYSGFPELESFIEEIRKLAEKHGRPIKIDWNHDAIDIVIEGTDAGDKRDSNEDPQRRNGVD